MTTTTTPMDITSSSSDIISPPAKKNEDAAAAAAHPMSVTLQIQNDSIEEAATACKQRGNERFAARRYDEAQRAYLEGLQLFDQDDCCDGAVTKDKDIATHESTSSLMTQANSNICNLQAVLHSNRAMALLKLQRYEEALEECHRAQALDPDSAKVYFRRALARKGLWEYHLGGSSSSNKQHQSASPQDTLQLLEDALDDLAQCRACTVVADEAQVQALQERLKQVRDKEIVQRQQQHAIEMETQRIVNESTKQAQEHAEMQSSSTDNFVMKSQTEVRAKTNGNHSRDDVSTSSSSWQQTHATDMPLPAQQRQDVVRLFLSHASAASVPKDGEAYFLLDWNWWKDWCRHVDFFYTSKQNLDQDQQRQRQEQVLRWLPPGATLPVDSNARSSKRDTDRDYNDDEDNNSSSSTDEDDDDDLRIFPRPIDNSSLLLTGATVFERHWYYPTSDGDEDDDDSQPRLKPHLVRGHHFEVVPREVYHALRLWHGETTPPLVRRILKNRLQLYPPPNSTKPGNVGNICGACFAPHAKARCKQCLRRYYCNRSCQESHWKQGHKAECKSLRAEIAPADYVANRNDDINDGPQPTMIRVGLHNLGNSCFMNAALICLSHATPLTRHFLSNQFLRDLNALNPLGTGGKLALAYQQVLKELSWRRTNKAQQTAVSPTSLKRAIALFAPRFAGCSQHDAQEFLAYLLDGLHEDLNRIRKAPYVHMPDVTGSNMSIAGAEAWDAHRRRNDSLVMDTFYGQFKSTCVCPRCNRVSVSFDAFNHVSLEIPSLLNLTRTIPVLVFRDESHDQLGAPPIRYGVTVRRGGMIIDVKQALSELSGIHPMRMQLCDVYEHIIYEIFQDNKPVASIRASDVVVAYEVDPYTNASIHAVASHVLVQESDRLDVSVDGDLEASEENLEFFGYPLLMSFDVQSSCRDVWEHVWNRVATAAAYSMHIQCDSTKGIKENRLKSCLRIRVVDNTGKPRPVFLDDGDVPAVGSNGIDAASILPNKSTEKISAYLGRDCADRFLFLRLEWLDDAPESAMLDKRRCMTYSDHASLIEAFKKESSMNGVKGVTLDQCFETFTRPERLDEHNMWYCSVCKEHVRAMKTMELWRLPNILVVHLKRFEFKHTLRRDKLDTFVNCPQEGLDMNRHCAAFQSDSFVTDNVPAVYDLFAVVNHYGRMGFGHYTAFARRWDEQGISREWFLFDDSNVQSVGSDAGVVTPAAYVLFYRRRVFH